MLFQAHPSEVSAACVLHPVAPDCLKISISALQNGVIKIVAGAQKGACSMQGAALSALRKSSFRYCHYVHLAGEQTAREAEWLLRVQSQAGAGSDQSLSQARGEVPAGSPQPPALPRASCHVFCKFSILLEGPVFHQKIIMLEVSLIKMYWRQGLFGGGSKCLECFFSGKF